MEIGQRVRDARARGNKPAHVVSRITTYGDPVTRCGKVLFYATPSSKGRPLCRRCKEHDPESD